MATASPVSMHLA